MVTRGFIQDDKNILEVDSGERLYNFVTTLKTTNRIL